MHFWLGSDRFLRLFVAVLLLFNIARKTGPSGCPFPLQVLGRYKLADETDPANDKPSGPAQGPA